ncbi:type I polyketide synthase [Nostoc sphaeroides]|uniref:Phenolphthiocerol/phthiocerol polyketide synthase subunit E n=1 Tax=Nostoc sphaeroides CCNUC1 TaxID=2653204 RepID=A0A5P8WJ94_9NOSO|nr:type I polyketide synthase [Nostoc sphaeroides]QFS52512.1 beta-ketoacyl synthase [Nostoc sphaeroides CCNUC1]
MDESLQLPDFLHGDEIAIIGMTCRVPGAKNPEEFWENLCAGVESITHFSEQELEAMGVALQLLKHPNYVKASSVLDDIEFFDALFFGFSAHEAEITDPQHRLFLECAWEALERAGYNPETYAGLIGVYAGVGYNNYLLNNLYPNWEPAEAAKDFQLMIATDKDYLTTRVSYKLNLRGPSINVQTACSTSLVAVHLACQSLMNGECDMVLAGSVAVGSPQKGYLYQEGMIYSPDGHCRAFDAHAQGTVSGDGVGVVVLKRLTDAITDGDHILACIKGTALNNDGFLKIGYTAPSIEGQAAVIQEAQSNAGVTAESITYVETHGTGTSLGDPIEITALTQAFRASTSKKGFCAIGSVKTNIGHLGTAAGMAGLIKTVLALQHKQLPPSLHFESPNPSLDFANSPFYVNNTLREWSANGTPRRAGVSSFGIGGTNAHVILEEAPILPISVTSRSWHLILLSAKTATALEQTTTNLGNYLQMHPQINLADAAYSLSIGRKKFNHRRMLVCHDLQSAVFALTQENHQQLLTAFEEARERSVVFMFSGQGSQYLNMGWDLYQQEPIFREQIQLCCQLLQPHLGLDLLKILYPQASHTETATQKLQNTAIAQPAIFVIEYALAQLWIAWGVRPAAMIGHSIGEYVAACLAGVFTLEDALLLIAKRGKLMQQQLSGAMLAVAASEQELIPYFSDDVTIAAINGPHRCVASGPKSAIDDLQQQLVAKGIESRLLHTSHAFHSAMMESVVEPFIKLVQTVSLRSPQIPYLSNLTGTWITTTQATNPDYWGQHLREPVRFSEGLEQLFQQPQQILLEVGPGHTLSTLATQHPKKAVEQIVLASIRHPQNPQSDLTYLLTTVGQMWLAGVNIDWFGFYDHEHRHKLPLPTYPFERQRYWIDAPQIQQFSSNGKNGKGVSTSIRKNSHLAEWFYIPSWKRSLIVGNGLQELATGTCWLIFSDQAKLGIQLAENLRQVGAEVIVVESGVTLKQQQKDFYTLNPQAQVDYEVLLQQLHQQGKFPQRIVHLWSLNEEDSLPWQEKIDRDQDFGFYSLLYLAQSLGKQADQRKVELTVISNSVQEVIGTEKLSPAKAMVMGPIKVIPQEYPQIRCCHIDVELPSPDHGQQTQLVNQLLMELSLPSDEQVVAYRGNYRWVQTFEPIHLPSTDNFTLRNQGVYLITGGLGGIGLVLAEYLAKTVQAKLVLLGRSSFPSPETWQNWLITHNAEDPVSHQIRRLQAIEAVGAKVLVISADVADRQQLQTAIAQAKQQYGTIHGVIHAAGIAGGGLIERKTRQIVEQTLAPKVKGTLLLHELLQDTKLDFLLLVSSIVAILGEFGLVDYCAANVFLDVFAQQTNWSCITWDGWRDVGMGSNANLPQQLQAWHAEGLERAILPDEGTETFSRILNSGLHRVVVSTHDLLYRVEKAKTLTLESLLDNTEKSAKTQSAHPRPQMSRPYEAPRNNLEEALSIIWQKLFNIEPIGINDNFLEIGGDSLLATQLVSRVRQGLQIELPLQSLFVAPTVAELAEYIENLRQKTADLSDADGVVANNREEISI